MAEVTLEDAPRKAREMFDKGFAAMERNNLRYAADMFASVLDLEPRLLKARRYLRAAQLKQVKGKKGGNPLAHIGSTIAGIGGMISVNSGINKDPNKALKDAEKLLKIDPLNPLFINLHVSAAEAADMPEVAIQTLEASREFYPKDIKFLKRLGQLYLDHEETRKGRECFELLLSISPNDPVAVKAFKDASALDTMQKGGWNQAGSYRDIMKDSKEATRLEQENKAVKTGSEIDALIADSEAKILEEPGNINYKRNLADLYMRSDRLDDALKMLTEAQELSGGGDPQIDRSLSAVRIKQFEEVITERQATGDEAGAEEATQQLNAFRLEDAEERVRRYPNDLQFRYDLGVMLYENEKLTEAIQQFQQSQRNPQRRTRSLYYLALCFKAKQQYDIAMEQLQKAIAELQVMDSTKKEVLYEMGTLCEAMGQDDKAAQYFKEIYSVDIGFKDVAAKIEKTSS